MQTARVVAPAARPDFKPAMASSTTRPGYFQDTFSVQEGHDDADIWLGPRCILLHQLNRVRGVVCREIHHLM